MGRPSKFNPATAGVLERAVRLGLPIEVAATLAGIAPSTVFDWLRLGRANKSPARAQFADRVDKARAEAACEAWTVVWKAGDRDWKAAAMWLQLAHPREFGAKGLARQVKDANATLDRILKEIEP
jgi:hypothetical protein